MIVIRVTGVPAPKGSARAMNIGGRARLIASSSGANARKQAAWVAAVRRAWSQERAVSLGSNAIRIDIEFIMPRPRGHYGTGRNEDKIKPSAPDHPIAYPDVDKLIRCTLDALSGFAFDDDSQIVHVNAKKRWSYPGAEPGAEIAVRAYP